MMRIYIVSFLLLLVGGTYIVLYHTDLVEQESILTLTKTQTNTKADSTAMAVRRPLNETVTTAEIENQVEAINPLALDADQSDPAVAIADEVNKEIIAQQLADAEDRAFDDKDMSSEAITHTDLTADILEDVIDTSGFLSITPYKELELYNINTGEKISVVFWADGDYIPQALAELDRFMRDWRKDAVISMDPDLYNLVYELSQATEPDEPVHLISGHRSKKTNDALRAIGRKTAKKSQHVLGKAADIRIPGVRTQELREEALDMKVGGVGFYPKDGFVHVDTGRVRQW